MAALTRTLDRSALPMVLWAKAKKLGVWDPADIDLEGDREHWLALTVRERETLLHLTSLFVGGEEAVAVDLLPLISVIASEGRIEEEIYLTSFLWEEAKHVDAFHRFLEEVVVDPGDLGRFRSPSYRRLFEEELPGALDRLRHDPSPTAQARASVTYNLIVEGVLAETGYRAYHAMLERNGIMPGMLEVVDRLKTDESRHIAYGVHLLTRLVSEHGEPVWDDIQGRMAELLPLAIGVISEIFEAYDEMAFGLELAEFTDFATSQFESRFKRIERAVAG
ncbi:MAG TPA: R2-like ligand-binding oxidase [Candidatus Sulfomarinibacteraceae bacterium]|nr:R2-like ligand-binding oxidase [Candidatus Sulfomarinibacteraceae bacterium]